MHAFRRLPFFQKLVAAVLFSSLLFLGIGFSFCKNKAAEKAAVGKEEAVELPADFPAFYKKWHEDSVFQLAHIQFPLPERNPERGADGSIELNVNWSAADWKIQTLPVLNPTEFQREFIPVSDKLMLEQITTNDQIGYKIERRWAKLGDEWMLIFYSAGIKRGEQ